MKITVICVGKIKEKYFVSAVDEYKKRLGKYSKLEIIEVEDERTIENTSDSVRMQIKKKEGQRILRYLKEDAYIIVLAIEGRMVDSIEPVSYAHLDVYKRQIF